MVKDEQIAAPIDVVFETMLERMGDQERKKVYGCLALAEGVVLAGKNLFKLL
jgi:hypothetical protein